MSRNGYSGLCATCVDRATCTFPKYEDSPRIFCEEFDWAWQRKMALAATAKVTQRERIAWTTAVPPQESQYKGLCATCAKQDECTFPKAAEGIWHCEEFE